MKFTCMRAAVQNQTLLRVALKGSFKHKLEIRSFISSRGFHFRIAVIHDKIALNLFSPAITTPREYSTALVIFPLLCLRSVSFTRTN